MMIELPRASEHAKLSCVIYVMWDWFGFREFKLSRYLITSPRFMHGYKILFFYKCRDDRSRELKLLVLVIHRNQY